MNAPVRILFLSSAVCVALLAVLILAVPVGAAVVAFVACVFVVLCIRFPVVAWVGYVASFSASSLGLQVAGANLQAEMLCVPLLLLAARRGRRIDSESSSKTGPVVLWSGILLWFGANVSASLLNSPQPVKSLRIVALIACSVMAFTIVRRLDGRLAARYVIVASVFLSTYGVVILCAWSVAQASGRTNALVVLNYGESVYRAKGLMIEPNLLGSLFVLFMCTLFLVRNVVPYWLLMMCMAVLGASAFLTFTRAAWVGMIVLLAVWAFTGRRAVLKTTVVSLGGVFSIGLVGAVLTKADQVLGATFSERISGILDFGSGTGAYRARVWETALSDYFGSSQYLIGLGTNSFSQRHLAQDSSSGEAYLGNFWVALIHDSGLIGVIGFVLIVAAVVSGGRHFRAIPLFLTLIVTAFATNPMWFAFPWICLGLMLALNNDQSRGGPDVVRSRELATVV